MLLNCSVGEDSWESLDCKEIQPVHPKGDQSWVFIGRTDAEAETPVLWSLHAKSWLIGKDPGAGKVWRQEEKGTTEDELAGWHYQLDGHEFEWTLGVGDGQGGLACCNSWGRKELDMTERLNWTELMILFPFTLLFWVHFCKPFLWFLLEKILWHLLKVVWWYWILLLLLVCKAFDFSFICE